jgi:hypothetical protein
VYNTVGNADTIMYTLVAGAIQIVTADKGNIISIAMKNISANAIRLLESVINITSLIHPTVG